MAPPLQLDADTRTFIQRLDAAVALSDPRAVCDGVKAALIDASFEVPASFQRPSAGGYARRLLHHSPERDYSVLVMVWGPGQGTAVHDHAGKWCVECVMKGQIEITSYRPTTAPDADVVRFDEIETVTADPREVGILVPPNEYHRIRNVARETAVTVHVYQGEMLWCHLFHEIEPGTYRRERSTLELTPQEEV